MINLIGGLIIGIAQHDLTFAEAGKIYTLLTIGDGLVAQIPSLLLSLATAIVVTRVTTTESITEQASTQLANPTALFISAAILVILGMVPGMPHLMFITLSVAAAGLGLMIISKEVQEEQAVQAEKTLHLPRDLKNSTGTTLTKSTSSGWKLVMA